MRQYVHYAKWIRLTNRRRSDGTHLDGAAWYLRAVGWQYIVGTVSRSEIHWAGLIIPDFAQLSGKASRNRWCLRALLKTGRVGTDYRWFGSAFQNTRSNRWEWEWWIDLVWCVIYWILFVQSFWIYNLVLCSYNLNLVWCPLFMQSCYVCYSEFISS